MAEKKTPLERRRAFRHDLATETQCKMPAGGWSAIKEKVDTVAVENDQEAGVVNFQLKRKVRHLQYAVIGIAAALLVVVLMPFSLVNREYKDDENKSTLLALVDENRVLQESLDIFNETSFRWQPSNMKMISALQDIDLQIQQAYLNNASTEQKILLWRKRKQLLIGAYEASRLDDTKRQKVIVI